MMRWKIIAALLLLAAGAQAIAEDTIEDEYVTEFVAGNLVFILLHEFAHLIIEDFDVPVLGNNEDAADTLAAVALIRLDRQNPERDYRYIRGLLAAADGQRILWERGLERDNPVAYLLNHPLSVQRFARISCLTYGSDPDLLEPLPDILGLPDHRAFWCEEEYEAAENAWDWVRDTYVLQSEGSTSGHQVKYGSTNDPDLQAIRDRLVQNRVLERIVEVIEEFKQFHDVEVPYLLTDEITLMARSCGVANAYWDGNDRKLVICYELIRALYELAEDEHLGVIVDQFREYFREERAGSDNED